MGFGIVEPKTDGGEHVPGTAFLYEGHRNVEHGGSSALKHASGRNPEVILVPQPSNSPNDPLNWPTWKKEMTFWSICFSVGMAGALGPILSPVEGAIAQEFNVSISEAALPAGYPLLTAGCMAYISQILAPMLGKRPVYILCTIILFFTTVWMTQVKSFNELLAARTVQGLGNGAYESIVISSIGDLFFLHQRGKRIVIYNIVTLGMANLIPVPGGYISQKYGWRMQFKILIAFTAIALLLIIFACPEHGGYNRAAIYETDVASTKGLAEVIEKVSEDAEDGKDQSIKKVSDERKADPSENSSTVGAGTPSPQEEISTEERKTYLQELMPFDRLVLRPNPLILALRPFVCFFYPAVFWGFTVGGLWSSWTIGLSIVVAQIFGAPPNLFGPEKLGYLFTFPFVFIIIGCILGFLLSDWYPKWAARRNGGVFEPEFRLLLLVPVLFVGIPGIFGFGYYASSGNVHWAAASCLQGLIAFASILAASVSFNYVLDCHRTRSVEVSVAIIMLRNFFWFGSSYFLPDWLVAARTFKVFDVVGGMQLGITLLSIFVYIYGKVMRQFVHRHDPLKIFGLA